MTSPGAKQITKGIWRLLEVYLFFVVSVMGGVCFGKIAQTGKSKLSQKTEIHQVDYTALQKRTLECFAKPHTFKSKTADSENSHYSPQITSVSYWRSMFTDHFFGITSQKSLFSTPTVASDNSQQNFPLII
jgi:hypothetical protein